MNYLVISDSHGMIDELELLVNKYKNYQVIHCGDMEIPESIIDKLGILYVKGNCDRYGPKELIMEDRDIYVTHGHLYNVKFKYDNIYYRGKELDAKYVLFGHTHIPYIENINGMWLINPGSLRFSKTYVLIEEGIPRIIKL